MSMVRMIVGGVDTHADTHVAAVIGAGGGAVEAGDAGSSSDELHAATTRIMTAIGATVLNCCRQLLQL